MRLELSKKADYAVRAVLDIARHYPHLRTNRQMTAAMDLPGDFLSQILGTLVRRDLLQSTAGPAGGYTLVRPPAETTLLQVIEAIEGVVDEDKCLLSGGSCDWARLCPFHETWSAATTGFANRLAATTFQQIATIDRAIAAGTYDPPPHAPPHPATPPRRGANH